MAARVRRDCSGAANTHYLGYNYDLETSYYYSNPHSNVCYDRTNPGPPYRYGGSLLISKNGLTHTPSAPISFDTYYDKYSGSFILGDVPNNGWWTGNCPPEYGDTGSGSSSFDWAASGAYISSVETNLYAQGSTGYNRAKPGRPIVDFGVAIGELRNIPTIPGKALISLTKSLGKSAKDRGKFFKELGSDYLNLQFGWKPFLKDLASLVDIQESLHQRLSQLRRDNGQSIRRRVTLEDSGDLVVSNTNSGFTPSFYPFMHPFTIVDSSGSQTVTVTTWNKIWFAGKFRYYIPDLDDPASNARLIRKLLGLNPTPDVLWNLLPWTWLSDWFINVGDTLSNLNDHAAENLVCEYGYVMHDRGHSTKGTRRGRLNLTGIDRGTPEVICGFEKYQSVKERVVASPYGFGLTPGDLSGYQLSVLGALGIQRAF